MKNIINCKLNLRKIFLVLLVVAITPNIDLVAQVTIGSSALPNKGSLLDLKENEELGVNSKRGLLLPRVALDEIDDLNPISGSENSDKLEYTGLFVYNVTSKPLAGLCPGVYIWTSTKWKRLQKPCTIPVDEGLLLSPNCYIVKPGQISEEIPVGKAYAVWIKYPELGVFESRAKVSVEILWQDKQNLIEKVELFGTEAEAKFQVKAKSGEGNALAAVRIGPNGDSTDPIVWSWHIWVTDYNPEGANTQTNKTFSHSNGEKEYVFMDRNLGFLSNEATQSSTMGLLYQWGRKDPFTSGKDYFGTPTPRVLYSLDNTELTEVNELGIGSPVGTGIQHIQGPTNNTLKSSIINPTSYYYGSLKYDSNNGSLATFDWYSDNSPSVGNLLWGTETEKSEFDPCPKGWRVPAYSSATKSPWAKFEYDIYDQSLATFDNDGITLNAVNGATELGFYPFGFSRTQRAFNLAGPIGSASKSVGGLFYNAYSSQDPEGSYWTATAVKNSSNAKLEYFRNTAFGMSYIQPVEAPRAQASWVRCVRK